MAHSLSCDDDLHCGYRGHTCNSNSVHVSQIIQLDGVVCSQSGLSKQVRVKTLRSSIAGFVRRLLSAQNK